MSVFASEKINTIKPYVPGEQPEEGKYIKLNTNESPYPPSPAVISAVAEFRAPSLRLYSDIECKALRSEIAKKHSVSDDMVFVGNGSDECLNFFFMANCPRGVAYPEISYGFYSVFASLHGIEKTEIPLTKDYTVNPENYFNIGKSIVIANPNAPTGIAMPLAEIENIVRENPDNAVLIDEAYVDFGAESAIGLVEKYNNLLVVRTFSKSASLAGARLGYAVGQPELIADLNKIKFSTNPYNINSMSQAAGAAALESWEYYEDKITEIISSRGYVTSELERLGFCVLPSRCNFIFAKSDRIEGGELYRKLKERGILVRHFDSEKIEDFNRITIGDPNQCGQLILCVKEILKNEKE